MMALDECRRDDADEEAAVTLIVNVLSGKTAALRRSIRRSRP
jgi:hypothetical protein